VTITCLAPPVSGVSVKLISKPVPRSAVFAAISGFIPCLQAAATRPGAAIAPDATARIFMVERFLLSIVILLVQLFACRVINLRQKRLDSMKLNQSVTIEHAFRRGYANI